MKLYMFVTADEYEFPVAVSPYIDDLVSLADTTKNALLTHISKHSVIKVLGERRYVVRVNDDDDNLL